MKQSWTSLPSAAKPRQPSGLQQACPHTAALVAELPLPAPLGCHLESLTWGRWDVGGKLVRRKEEMGILRARSQKSLAEEGLALREGWLPARVQET